MSFANEVQDAWLRFGRQMQQVMPGSESAVEFARQAFIAGWSAKSAAAPVSDAKVEAAAKALWDENEAQEVAATDAGHYDRRRGSYKPVPWSAADEYDRPEYLARARNALAAARAVSGEDTGDE